MIETGYTITDDKISFIKMSYKKGLSYFAELGYIICRNSRYMQKGENIVHFNTINKHWIVKN